MNNSIKEIAGRYLKFVYWSDEDDCYVGMCPDLFGGGCHGDNQEAVHAELVEICEEFVENRLQRKMPLPPPTAHDWANRTPFTSSRTELAVA